MTNILIGPLKRDSDYKDIISSYEILGDFAASPEILTFGEMDLLNDNEILTSFDDVLESLPITWKPECVIFWGIDKGIIPSGIEYIDQALIGVVFSWNLAFEAVLKNVSRFDWIFTDKKGEQLLKSAGVENVSSIQLRGFSPSLHRKLENVNKEYDIFFSGNLNQDIYKKRNKLLYQVAKLSNKYKILATQEVYGDEYVELLNKSKIVINHCNKDEANLRTFETLACESLLFVDENNLELKDYFTDKEHCIFYKKENLNELLEYYLKHDDEREKIAKQGYEKVQEYTYENMFDNLIKKIESQDFSKLRKYRTFSSINMIEQHKIKAKQALQSMVTGKFYIVEKELKEALSKDPMNSEILNNLGVIYANAYFALMEEKDHKLLTLAKKHLSNAIANDSMYAMARFNLGMIYYLEKDYQKAEEVLESFIINASIETKNIEKFRGFYYASKNISYHNDFKIEWEKNIYTNYKNNNDLAFGYCDLLLNKTLEVLGDIALENLDYEKAEELFKNALQAKDDIGFVSYKLGKLLKEQGRYEEALKFFQKNFDEKPLYPENWTGILDCLDALDMLDEYESFCMELLSVIKISSKYLKYKTMINQRLAKIL